MDRMPVPVISFAACFRDPSFLSIVVAKVKMEILADMEARVVPKTVTGFSQLHNYVDANMYGGACEWEDFEACDDEHIAFLDCVQTVVDRWLASGHVRNVTLQEKS